ncbi:MAG: ATP-binding cassette domain-containing protein [Gallicola sp.]|nr:ATP-binding cassette domain-containing protein [Gallicola sp.]
MLELKNIHKVYNEKTINEKILFRDFNFKVEKGDFISIVGSNGSGKTSMLNIICGSIPIEGGSILLDGHGIEKLPEYKRYENIGRVFQDPSVGTSPSMTLLENLSMAENKGKSWNLTRAVNKDRIDYYKSILAPLGLHLEDQLETPVGRLSGGQRQAISLLMTTMTDVDYLILDEHTAALDPKTASVIMDLTEKIIKEKNLTAIMVTHNLRHAVKYGNRLVMMHEGQAIMDLNQEEKEKVEVDTLLNKFYEISIEYGN